MLKMVKIDKERWGVLEIYLRIDGNKVTRPLITGFSKEIVKICYDTLKKEFENIEDLKKAKQVLNKLKSGKTETIPWKNVR